MKCSGAGLACFLGIWRVTIMKKLLALVSVLALGGLLWGCTPRMAGHIVGAAIVTAAVVGTAHAIHHHDHHFHHYNCGCLREWHDDHWVYWYQDGWEYYDPHAGVWYRYR
jgi:hypothetical protein